MATDERTQNKRKRNSAIKLRVYPTAEQAAQIDHTFDCCRFLWNQMLADEQEFYAATGEHFIPAPARYKKDFPFLKEADSLALSSVHQNLRRAFQKFFDQPEHYRYPVFKRQKDARGSYTTYCQYFKSGPTVYLTDEGIRLPKIGILRANFHRKPLHWWTLKSATVSKTATGKYFCSLLYEFEEQTPEAALPTEDTTLGVNFSPARLYVDSEGGTGELPEHIRKTQEKLALAQRRLSRMERGSKNYEQQLQKIRLLHERIANQRRDHLHKESRRMANSYDAVCVSDLNLREVSRQMKQSSAMDAGFGELRVQLAYKLERQGKQLITVKKYSPTARTCARCGHENTDAPAGRSWKCEKCGAKLDRAENAAVNIKKFGLEQQLK